MNYGEAYVEFWANTIQCSIMSYYISVTRTEFLQNFKSYMDIELSFSINQANKIFGHLNMKYNDFLNGSIREIYKEKTNVFCYYILKTLFLYFKDCFFEWCLYNNINLIVLKDNHDLYKFIVKYYTHPQFVRKMNQKPNGTKKNKSLRMTIIDLPEDLET